VAVIDAQVHVWDHDRADRPWDPAGVLPMHAQPFTAEHLITAMDAVGIDAALLVSSKLYGFSNSYVIESVQRFPDRFAAVGRVDLTLPQPQRLLEAWSASPEIVAGRIVLMAPSDVDVFRSADAFFAAAQRHRIPLCVYPRIGLPEFSATARRNAGLQFVIDHVGLAHPPLPIGREPFAELPEVLALAELPNVAVKLSCLPLLSSDGYPFPDLWPAIESVLGAYGPERVMWGSDLTQVRAHHTYAESIEYLQLESRLSPAERDMLFGAALQRVFGWMPVGRHRAQNSPPR
jgi:predicted TIM-barrel fold metal-dependent hydrolase